MREIVLDTETTGINPRDGHRIIEIGALELEHHLPTGQTYHIYINPEREIDDGAVAIHGITNDFLQDKPVFSDIVDEFLAFVGNDLMVIHNASFDMGFINAELARLDRPPLPMSQAIDTLAMARKKFPGAQANLNALCRRFEIDNAHRDLHGALVDADLLAEVYIELLGGRQPDLALGPNNGPNNNAQNNNSQNNDRMNADKSADTARHAGEVTILPARAHAPTQEEVAAHEAFIETLKDPIWRRD